MIIYDRGRLGQHRTKAFNQSLLSGTSNLSRDSSIPCSVQNAHDADSLKTPGIWASDFIAGAFYLWKQGNNDQYVNLLRPKFIGNGYVEF